MEAYTDGETRVGHWFKDECDVYIGRWSGEDDDEKTHILTDGVTKNEKGYWGNPFPEADHGREQCVRLFTDAFLAELDENEDLRRDVYALRGQTLGCYCRRIGDDEPICHGDVLARTADSLVVKK